MLFHRHLEKKKKGNNTPNHDCSLIQRTTCHLFGTWVGISEMISDITEPLPSMTASIHRGMPFLISDST